MTTGVPAYSTTPANNVNANTGVNWDEGMSPGAVNNSARANMADLRTAFNDLIWFQYGSGTSPVVTPAYASGTSFTVAGIDVTTPYHAGRRVKAVGSGTGTIYGSISSSSFSTNTTVNVTWDSGSLTNEALTIYLSQVPITGKPSHINAVAGLGAGVATFLATPTSANLLGALTDETGTGAAVFADSPIFTTAATLGAGGTGGGSLYYIINGGSGAGANFGTILKANGSVVGSIYYDVSSGRVHIASGSKDPAVSITANTGALTFHGYGAGTLTTDASGNVTASSDETLKYIVGPFMRGTADIVKIDTCQWKWNEASEMDGSTVQSSYTAQAVQAGVPEAISVGPDGKLTVFDGAIIAALINAVRELNARLETAGIA